MAKEMKYQFDLPSDEDGYIEYECPTCLKIFRLNKNLFQNQNGYKDLYCPYCGLKDVADHFYTTECVKYMEKMQEYLAQEYINQELKELVKKSKGLLKMEPNHNNNKKPQEFSIHFGIDGKKECKHCGETFKVDTKAVVIAYCPYCGDIQ